MKTILRGFIARSKQLVLMLSLIPALGHAAGQPADCAALTDDALRLNCYDTFFNSKTTEPEGEAELSEQTIDVTSPVLARRAEEKELENRWFSITPHRPNYILPASYNGSSDFEPYGPVETLFTDTEIKFQLSLKTTVMSDLWRDSSVVVAYTQQSYWQLYADDEISAPFRETNHEPEVIWQIPVNFELLGFKARQASLAFVHQSNGRARPLSRSWNRIAGELVFERERFVVTAKTWSRIDNPDQDDNPRIEEYMGRLHLGAAYIGDRHTFAIGLKNSLGSSYRSGVELSWMFPLTHHLKGYVQVYSGYGENLIDMENSANRISIGVALTDWL